jgi:nucleoside-diphosphate-sugar epimerase
MRVLVTGAAGRVGANVVRRLVAAGIDVTATVLPGDPQAAKLASMSAVRVVEADLGDQAAVDRACEGATHVAHLAAQLVRADTPVDRFYDTNAFGTLRLLEGLLRHGDAIDRFVLVSTDGTYRPGDPPSVPLSEDAPQAPADYYGTAKLLGEVILRNHSAQYDIPFSILRFATVVSPEEAPGLFRLGSWRRMVRLSKLGRDTHIWQLFRDHPEIVELFETAVGDASEDTAVGFVDPDGEPWTIHLVDVRDAAEGVFCALTGPGGASGRAFNIAARHPTSHELGAAIVAEAYGVPKLMIAMPMRWRLEMTTGAAREGLGFEARHDYRGMVAAARATDLADDDRFIPARV